MQAPIPDNMPRSHLVISVLWPSFGTAIIATGLFFSAVHPRDLVPFDLDIDVSPIAAYSIGFFLFWLLGIVSSYGTLYFTISNARFVGNQEN